MSHSVVVEAIDINGKPVIYINEKTNDPVERRTVNYKNRNQRFPLRDKVAVTAENDTTMKQTRGGRNDDNSDSNSSNTKTKGGNQQQKSQHQTNKTDTVTLSSTQLAAILESVGRISNPTKTEQRNNANLRIKIGKDRVNIEAISPRVGRGNRSHSAEINAARNVRFRGENGKDNNNKQSQLQNVKTNSIKKPPAQQTSSKENLLSLLSKVNNSNPLPTTTTTKTTKVTQRQLNDKKLSNFKPTVGSKRMDEDSGSSTTDSSVTDAVMKRVIAENKDKLSEKELIDLLAQVYLQMKKPKNLPEENFTKQNHRHVVASSWEKERERQRSRSQSGSPSSVSDSYSRSNSSRRRKRRSSESSSNSRHRHHHHKSRGGHHHRHHSKTRNRQHHNERHRTMSNEKDESNAQQYSMQFPPAAAAPPPQPLTMAEKKKLQWEKERAEMARITDYNPWGKPGAGAPPLASPSLPLSDRKHFIESVTDMTGNKSSTVTNTGIASQLIYANDDARRHQEDEARRRWISELNAQRDEKRATATVNSPIDLGITPRVNAAGGGGGASSSLNTARDPNAPFVRGRGLADLEERQETDEKRRKMLEHQEAIRQQVEERQQMKQREREKRIAEEMAEEARLERERQAMQRPGEDSQARQRQREEQSRLKAEHVKETLDAAEEAAKLNKQLKRLERLELGGHDTSHLKSNNLIMDHVNNTTSGGGGTATSNDIRWAAPSPNRLSKPPPNDQSRDEAIQTDYQLTQSLLLSQYPVPPLWPPFDPYRTQPMPPQYWGGAPFQPPPPHPNNTYAVDSRASWSRMHQGYYSDEDHPQVKSQIPIREPPTQQHLKRQVNESDKRSQQQMPTVYEKADLIQFGNKIMKRKIASRGTVPIEKRPQWNNANPRGRRPVKQSERDPFYANREDQRRERQNQLLKLAAKNSSHIPQERPFAAAQTTHRGDNNNVDAGGDLPINSSRHMGSYPIHQTYGRHGDNDNNNIPPYVRTTDILRPDDAGRPIQQSRSYPHDKVVDSRRLDDFPPPPAQKVNKDPIFNPSLVTEHPTDRQDVIMRQLSSLRRGLLQKQKEIETSLSMTENFM